MALPIGPIVCIDLDGVLCRGVGRYEDRGPDVEQIRRLRALVELGISPVIWTSRAADFEAKRRSESWLRAQGVPFSRLVLGKPRFAALIDDRALPELPEDPELVIRAIKRPLHFRGIAGGVGG